MTIEQKVQAKIRGNINLTPAKWKLINDTIGFTLKEVGEILEKCDQENCWNLREVIEKLGIKQTQTKEADKELECDCKMFIGGSGKLCPNCSKEQTQTKEVGK